MKSKKKTQEKNIAIRGITEAPTTSTDQQKIEHDKTVATRILESLGIQADKINRIQRVRKLTKATANQIPALIIVEFKNKDDQIKTLAAAKNLRGSLEFPNTYINKDLTLAELEIEKQLRTERNKRNDAFTLGEGRQKYAKTDDGKDFYWGIRWGVLRKIDKTTNKPI